MAVDIVHGLLVDPVKRNGNRVWEAGWVITQFQDNLCVRIFRLVFLYIFTARPRPGAGLPPQREARPMEACVIPSRGSPRPAAPGPGISRPTPRWGCTRSTSASPRCTPPVRARCTPSTTPGAATASSSTKRSSPPASTRRTAGCTWANTPSTATGPSLSNWLTGRRTRATWSAAWSWARTRCASSSSRA